MLPDTKIALVEQSMPDSRQYQMCILENSKSKIINSNIDLKVFQLHNRKGLLEKEIKLDACELLEGLITLSIIVSRQHDPRQPD